MNVGLGASGPVLFHQAALVVGLGMLYPLAVIAMPALLTLRTAPWYSRIESLRRDWIVLSEEAYAGDALCHWLRGAVNQHEAGIGLDLVQGRLNRRLEGAIGADQFVPERDLALVVAVLQAGLDRIGVGAAIEYR